MIEVSTSILSVKKGEESKTFFALEKAKTAFRYGADAVYCGTSSLSLRTRADMKDDDLIKTNCIKTYLHIHNPTVKDKPYYKIDKSKNILIIFKIQLIQEK